AFGRSGGLAEGALSLSPDGRIVTLDPVEPLAPGDSVMVLLSHDLEAQDGSPLRAAGYSFQFRTAAAPAALDFVEVDRLTTRTTPEETSRAYGGFAADLDGDGWVDLTIVNEDTEDLRVFLNRADGSGLFDPFLEPTNPTGTVPSPSETGDFDRDGNMDVAVANTQGSSVSVLLGQGDGFFGGHQQVAIASDPRGIAVADADGDGDLDVAATLSSGNADGILLANDGLGVFAAAIPFGDGEGTPWALAAADFTEDGILDLVVGDQANEARVFRGNGNGTFSLESSQPVGGAAWMFATGDLDGDGHEDLASANDGSQHGSILLGNGLGDLGPPETYAVDPFVVASDLADLDGDGDLDWMLSSFGGDWTLFENDGNGDFSFVREFTATQAASCSVMFDMDRDGDLDLALIDELEDEVILMHNVGGIFADGFESGDLSTWDQAVP
ncbi:MAG: FG-GAP repeat domain-containing protein, partial [Thermoanaerobaculia bacterium]